eukprot:TRINITY_DN274_c0_g1_i1.p1 TRINITY_DN274_c0_g1~~TRINITY_DN274_c0_g1_i1.p1  ORF type:complete len:226 (-),score=50.83 TRINITY_DN274_c0_g1_i1:96-773(-)
MLIPKKSKITVYSYLFKEGVLVAKKQHNLKKHPDVDVPSLWVLKLMQSLKSSGYVRETFNWQFYYWYLTNEGIEYLREYLHLPREIVPATLKKTRAAPGVRPRYQDGGREGRDGGAPRERRPFPEGGDDAKKVGGADSTFQPRFNREGRDGRGPVGRGAGGYGDRPRFDGPRPDRFAGGRGGGQQGGRDSYRRDGAGGAGGAGGARPQAGGLQQQQGQQQQGGRQ